MVSATGDDRAVEDFFYSRMVFSEGAHIKCLRYQVASCPTCLSSHLVFLSKQDRLDGIGEPEPETLCTHGWSSSGQRKQCHSPI